MLWITGANGLLGTALLALKKDALGSVREQADVGDLESVRKFARAHPGITHIVNCAAFSLVDLAETKREEAYLANVAGPRNLGIVAQEIGAKLVHISTDYVFGGEGKRPLTESDPPAPCNYYGQTKWDGEKALLDVFPNACILRTSWIFGRGGKNFVAKMLQLLAEQKEIRLTANQWGRPTYASDLAAAILLLLDRSGLYQFANAGVTTKYEFGVAMFEEALKRKLPIATEKILPVPASFFPSACKRPVYSAFDTGKIERDLGLAIRPWREALKDFLCTICS